MEKPNYLEWLLLGDRIPGDFCKFLKMNLNFKNRRNKKAS